MKLATKLVEYINKAKLTEFSRLESLSLTSDNSLRVTLNRLAKQGKIYNPFRGLYVARDADPFWVAASIYPGYISLSSAFYLHHFVDEYPFTVFVGSNSRGSIKMGSHEFVYFKAKNYLGLERGTYPIASTEKAIFDSLRHGDMVSYPMLTKVLHQANINADRLMAICMNERHAFFQRLGYLLSLLPVRDAEKKRIISICKKRVAANVYLQGRKKGTYVKEWKIIDNVGKQVLLSWWQQ